MLVDDETIVSCAGCGAAKKSGSLTFCVWCSQRYCDAQCASKHMIAEAVLSVDRKETVADEVQIDRMSAQDKKALGL